MSEEYPRPRRITRSKEFRSISMKGRRVRTLDLDVRLLASPSRYTRVGIIVPRHGRTAVHRNLLKRRLRELARMLLLPVDESVDVVIRCKPDAYERTFDELKQQVMRVQQDLVENRNGRSNP